MEKNYCYQVDTYKSESPTFEGIVWSAQSSIPNITNYETAKRIYDEASDLLQHEDVRNICRIAQGRRSEEQALRQRGSSMHAETWEKWEGNKRVWFHLALYVTLPKAA